MDVEQLKQGLRAEAERLGFATSGIASVRPFGRARRLALEAISAGRMDGMPWFNAERVDAAADLERRYPWARAVVALAWPYRPAQPPRGEPRPPAASPGRPRGRMSAYACLRETRRPADYHTLLAARCDSLAAWLRAHEPAVRTKRFIDHGWAMDRPIAERAGLGFAGKHASVITREAGSYVLLAEMLVSLPFPPDAPSRKGCGTCRACLPACPTGAIAAPGVIDARRCISYLTIEHRGAIPTELRPLMGTWVFGCDLCQEACPINERLAPPALTQGSASTRRGPVPFPDLVECLRLSDDAFAERFRGTAVWRTGRAGLARNSAIALGNAGDRGALPALEVARSHDPDPVVRESAAWAIAQLSA